MSSPQEEQSKLDLHDIQGNIIKGYGRYGFPKARYIFYRIHEVHDGREFVLGLLPLVTDADPWRLGRDEKNEPLPTATTNIAFTYEGLKRLGLPEVSLHSFPSEFTTGMRARREILGDVGLNDPEKWDPAWKSSHHVQPMHMLVTINGRDQEAIEGRTKMIERLAGRCAGGIELVVGHLGDGRQPEKYQDASAIFIGGQPTAKEHFGYRDGIGDPYFKGSGVNPANVVGGGKVTRKDPSKAEGWEPLETGEFILGHRDEAEEYPDAPVPRLLSKNGTFLVYRKLHENVGTFNRFLEEEGAKYPEGKEALAAKFAGRWRKGAPVTTFPTEAEADAFHRKFDKAKKEYLQAKESGVSGKIKDTRKKYDELNLQLRAFNFNDDIKGGGCPMGAHIRRANPRGALEFGVEGAFNTPGALVNRRRIARRGLPYGEVKNPDRDDGNHGVIFMIICANIKRQFEFVQQQWMNYGNDFRLSNDKDPIIGDNGIDGGRMTIPGDKDRKPYFCSGIAQFVETRGGDYFFVPSLTALRMIGEGIVDPT